MGIEIVHHAGAGRLKLTLAGNLDLTLTQGILRACGLIDRGVTVCVIDVSAIERVFDSGIGLLMLLASRLEAHRVRTITIGEIPGLPASAARLSGLPAPHRAPTAEADRLSPA
jgi:anti-anti-sigma regulatory factor